jgi:hypothetical protein
MSTMATLYTTYPSERAARRAAEELRATGIREQVIVLLVGRRPGDVREQPVGGFARPVGPEAPVGTYGGGVLRRGQGAGTFAGDADRHRQGSFADADRVVIVTFEGNRERARISGLRGSRRLLRRYALDEEALDRAVDELARGRAVVLAELDEIAATQAEARLAQPPRAA